MKIHFVTEKRTWSFENLIECNLTFSTYNKLETTENPYLTTCKLCQRTEVFKELTYKYPEYIMESV